MKRIKLTRVSTTLVLLIAVELVQGRATDLRGMVTIDTTLGLRTQTTSQLSEERRIVQESSRRIAELVGLRPATLTPNVGEAFVQQQIDREIAAIRQARAQTLEALVLADNPRVELIDKERGIYRVPVTDGQGESHWFSGRIPAIWHLHRLDPVVFALTELINSCAICFACSV